MQLHYNWMVSTTTGTIGKVCVQFLEFWWSKHFPIIYTTVQGWSISFVGKKVSGWYHWREATRCEVGSEQLQTVKALFTLLLLTVHPFLRNSFTWSNYLPVIQCKLTKVWRHCTVQLQDKLCLTTSLLCIIQGSMVFGNSNVPTSLVVYFDSAAANYTVSAVCSTSD